MKNHLIYRCSNSCLFLCISFSHSLPPPPTHSPSPSPPPSLLYAALSLILADQLSDSPKKDQQLCRFLNVICIGPLSLSLLFFIFSLPIHPFIHFHSSSPFSSTYPSFLLPCYLCLPLFLLSINLLPHFFLPPPSVFSLFFSSRAPLISLSIYPSPSFRLSPLLVFLFLLPSVSLSFPLPIYLSLTLLSFSLRFPLTTLLSISFIHFYLLIFISSFIVNQFFILSCYFFLINRSYSYLYVVFFLLTQCHSLIILSPSFNFSLSLLNLFSSTMSWNISSFFLFYFFFSFLSSFIHYFSTLYSHLIFPS